MKITKELEAEALLVYNAYFDNYLIGDVAAMIPLLAEDYTQVGSAETEVFSSKKDAVQFIYDTIDQVAGKLQLRNRNILLKQQGIVILIRELCDVYALTDNDWSFYSKFRASSLLQKIGNEWKIIHQHSSFPEVRTAAGNNIAIEKISAENIQLRDAVKGRTVELENTNRELAIEASLERVRAIALSMQQPDDMLEVCKMIAHQLKKLGVDEIRNVQTAIFYVSKCTYMNYEYYAKHDSLLVTEVDYKTHPIQESFAIEMLKGTGELVIESLKGKAVKDWYDYQKTTNQFADSYLETAVSLNYYWYSLGPVALGMSTYLPLLDENILLFKRFRNVFELAYRRYNDIEKAKAMAREAQLEASLEKVRAVALSLKKSDEMLDVAEVLYKQLVHLGFTNIRNAIIDINNDANETFLDYDYSDKMGKTITLMSYYDSPIIEKQVRQIQTSNDAFFEIILQGEDLQGLIEMRLKNGEKEDTRLNQINELGYTLYSFGNGAIGISNFGLLDAIQKQILRRFRNVFAFAYKRYSDLLTAENQAHEAKIEIALERVRSRTLAMQHSDELAETAAVLFKQVINLGIEPNRLYITIIQDGTHHADFWITDEDGSKVSAAFFADMDANSTFIKMYEGWLQQKNSIIIDMQGIELQEYFKYLSSLHVPFKGGLSQTRRVQNIAYFSKGFIGMASPEPQPLETINLLERFAAVFNLTFTRFNDLKIAEAHAVQAEDDLIKLQREKKRAEDALAELKSTQQQLVQQEKLASLGALTAGIAHEIKNPLNFVNNFSELSNELIKEFKESKSEEERNEILSDLELNLTKINEHGKRADSIVKNMLQHSRTGSGEKQLTDINQLCEEYFNLAFHGKRATNANFNCEMIKQFDSNLPQINCVSQDISRVILNLISNAFDAVRERESEGERAAYSPTVTVITKSANQHIGSSSHQHISISIKDNGRGIPSDKLEKIFEPFFTTKPAGQGTGLGLSLSNDIIKAHGGELKVESIVGEGSEFIIQLPI